MPRLAVYTLVLLVALVEPALAHDGGEGWVGGTNDKGVTNAGFVLIALFSLFVFVMSVGQWRRDRRKEAR